MDAAAPPHSLDAERAVLGALLITTASMGSVRLDARLAPDDFYREQHGHAFAAMIELDDEGGGIDSITVERRMTEHGWELPDGGVDQLAGYVPAAGNVGDYAQIVRDLALKRALLREVHEIAGAVHSGVNARDLIQAAELKMLRIADATVSELARIEPAEEVERMSLVRDGRELVGCSSGFVDLDRLTAGFQAGNLMVLAARPSMGKSALAINIAENAAARGDAVALFSLEMSRMEILRRLVASRARVSGSALLKGPIPPDEWDRVVEATDEIGRWPLYVDDGGDAGVMDVRSKARRLRSRADVKLIVVDYLQLMRTERGENRNVEIAAISRAMKLLAKELDVAVLLVSQLSRALEHRTDKHPMLSDLRDSGSIEQDADVVMMLYRDRYYNEDAAEDVGELHVAKHRNGPVGKVTLTFLSRFPRFANHIATDEPVLYGPRTASGRAMPF